MANYTQFVYSEFYSESLLAVIVFVGLFFMLTDQRRRSGSGVRRSRR